MNVGYTNFVQQNELYPLILTDLIYYVNSQYNKTTQFMNSIDDSTQWRIWGTRKSG